MATGKGRKKGRNRDRDRSAGGGVSPESSPAPSPEPQPKRTSQQTLPPPRLPSPMARITGALLAAITAYGAVYMIMEGLGDDNTSASIARIVGGVLMAVIAVVVGVLSVAPELVLRMFGRRLP